MAEALLKLVAQIAAATAFGFGTMMMGWTYRNWQSWFVCVGGNLLFLYVWDAVFPSVPSAQCRNVDRGRTDPSETGVDAELPYT